MRRGYKSGLLWIATGLLFILLGQVLLLRNQNLGPELVLKQEALKVRHHIQKTQAIINAHLPEISKGHFHPDLESEMIKDFNREGVDVFIYRQNAPVFWTTQAFNVYPKFKTGMDILQHASRYIVQWSYFYDSVEYIFTREIITNPEFKFVSAGALMEEKFNKFSISANPVENSVLLEVKGLPLFSIVIEQFSPGIGFDLIVLFGLFIITIGIILIFRKTEHWYWLYILNLVLWLSVEFCFYKNVSLWNLKSIPLFTPEVYASSWYFPNLGIFLFNAVLCYVFASFILQEVKRNVAKIPNVFKSFLRVLVTVVVCIFTAFLISETGKLVRDSSIVFDFHEIHLISIYTVLGLAGVALGFGIVFRLFRILEFIQPQKKRALWFGLLTVPVVLGICYQFYLTGQILQSGLEFAFLIVFLSYPLWAGKVRQWVYLGLGILISSLIVAVIFNKFVDKKELELREILAAKILLQSEREPSNLLQKTELQLQRDNGIRDYYTCLDETKSDFDKRIRQLYFADYTEDFEILIFDYNAFGKGYREENPFEYQTLNTLYSSNACKPITRSFSLVNERKLKGSFLGRFSVSDSGNLLGTYFILLKPRVSSAQGRLSDVFHKSPLEDLFADNQYSYAFYSLNKLSRRYGQFNYPNTYTFTNTDKIEFQGGFSHFSYSDDLGNIIVISKPVKSWLKSLTAFTILVLSCLVVCLLYLLGLLIWQYFIMLGKQNYSRLRLLQLLKSLNPVRSGSNLFLSSKLQLYVILVVFATFIVVLFVTINYFKNSYSLRQREFLWNKTNEIANTIGTQANLDALFDKYQTGLVYDLSNYYSTDINIYNANGKLLVSSNDRIYDQDLVGSLMNPGAFMDFTKSGISGFIKEEKVGDLNYISAYYTIFDNDLNVKGYLNLPYFTNRQDLYREISNYASTIINLFALVFALAALVAYVIAHRITEPLNLIRRQMGLVKLGAKSSPIQWLHNDEIGLLIAEYNKMINELEESSNKLAESERQGAWREMAKQVAHEIKNPLTPMKLSLQHLQFAIQRKDENIDEKIRKTSELLINQIDSLSKMAEEFSEFAKMPEAKSQRVKLNTVLDEAVSLFSKEENLTINYSPMEKAVWVNADQHQLNRVFTNIIKNASQAIPENTKGLLRIHCQIREQEISIYFEDNGKGIPVELENKIFSPNFSTKNSGMGLGLAISQKIMEQFGGKIEFTSKGNKGTTFFVTMPLD